MRVPTDFCINQQKETIIQILTDHIIFERIDTGMQEIVKAANPDGEDWDPTHCYHGYSNAWVFLTGYEFPEEVEDNLKDELSEIFFMHVKGDLAKPFKERQTANELAKRIFIDWEFCIDRIEYNLKTA